jgi:hypothetical protein
LSVPAGVSVKMPRVLAGVPGSGWARHAGVIVYFKFFNPTRNLAAPGPEGVDTIWPQDHAVSHLARIEDSN